MSKSRTKQKAIAWFLLLVFAAETFYPVNAYALTSGPTTPEMSGFEPASTSNMVDLFSGDMTYNIPLLDVGGYPVNLAYHSGSGPDDEASWVGFGWSLNPGAVNRQLRGLPDDFNGDVITQEDNKKPNITVGGNVNASIKIFGNRIPKIKIGKKKKNLNGNMKVKIGILHNNYTGYKGMIGIGTGFNTSDDAADLNTKNLSPTSTDLSAGLGLNVDNQSGVNPYANFEVNFKIKTKKERAAEKKLAEKNEEYTKGLKEGQKFDRVDWEEKNEKEITALRKAQSENHFNDMVSSSSISFSQFQPPGLVQTPMVSKNFTASLGLGVTLFGGTVVPGIEGSYSKQELKEKVNTAPAYGFINGQNARAKEESILDYNMEKESPYFKRLPNLGVTVFTPDLFSVSSNAGSMQFRPYLRGTGIYFQPHKHDVDKSVDIGLEPGFGNIFHLGIPLQLQKTNNISGKWTTRNDYLGLGDFKSTPANDPANQAFYFKRVGEKNRQDATYFGAIGNTAPVAVRLDNSVAAWAFGNGKAKDQMRVKSSGDITAAGQARTQRDKANHSIQYLTSSEASKYALEKQLVNYRENTLPTAANAVKGTFSRTADYRKSHHISQYTITQDDGQRMVYGLPVYNKTQEEVSFAVPNNVAAIDKGVVVYNPGTDNSVNNTNGKDNYYHRYKTPAYTTGHLLTAILSPDYVDVSGNGISDDDLGTAVKFNYSMLSDGLGNPRYYKWRTPFSREGRNGVINQDIANFNMGYRSVPDDDKANYTWGEKELWYVHSIESKTMVAQFITQEDREDGVGVMNENGGRDGGIRQRRLMEIRLYSKSDLFANPTGAVPIKVVHFKYADNYPLMNLLPNNVNNRGKLTLEKIWFTYGNNTKGQYNSYTFKYNIPVSQDFQEMQSDRWGTYKPKADNPNSNLSNMEFPYAIQDKTKADVNASNWQLSEIELPSGGVINIDYESDDYAYVQDRRAAQMCFVNGMGGLTNSTGFANSDEIFVKLPQATTATEFKKRYLEGISSVSYKMLVNLDGKGHWEYVSGYAEVDVSQCTLPQPDVIKLKVKKINGYNPVAKASWQKLKLELPRYAYPEYDNLDAEGSGFVKAIKALAATFGRFKDLVENFDQRAKRKGFGNTIDLAKSWVRLNTPVGLNGVKGKLGGGHRVKEIRISDKWTSMSGVANAETGIYGQRYNYTTLVSGPSGTEAISSGVASYEPTMGGDENPFHEPINYVDKHLFGMPKYFYLERPMGESYFPSASVGYSKVTVMNLGADGSVGSNGSTVNEYYTAKDFPVKVDDLPIERKQPRVSFLPRLFGAKITTAVTVSQGYVVENNDMHGKPKAEAVYGKNGNEISSAKYHYKVNNPSAEKPDLKNTVSVIDRAGIIDPNAIVGMDIDMFTEMNESMMENMGVSVDPSFGVTFYPPALIKVSFKLPLPKPNYEKRLYRGSSTIKLVNRYGILEKTVKTVNGSTSVAENLLWDAETGEVLLSKVNNEFKESTYSFNYPAHWAYDGMGSSFRNEGIYLAGFATDNITAQIPSVYYNLLMPGDELADLGGNKMYWVTKPYPASAALYLVDKEGKKAPVNGMNMKLVRSGRRNLAIASVGTVVTMNNPISGNTINFNTASKVLQSGAVEYNQEWMMPVSTKTGAGVHYLPQDCISLPVAGKTSTKTPGDSLIITQRTSKGVKTIRTSFDRIEGNGADVSTVSCLCTCLKKLFDYLIATNQLFITQAQNKTVGQMVAAANAAGYNVGSCSILDNNANKPFYALSTATTGTVYTVQVGECVVSIRSNSSNPVSFYSLVSKNCGSSPVVEYGYGNSQTIDTTFYADYNQLEGFHASGPPFSILCNGPKLKFGEATWGLPNGAYYNSQLRFPGMTQIPANATIVSANLYLYAHPDGYDPPSEPNAHITDAQLPPGQYLFVATPNAEPTPCVWNGFTANNAMPSGRLFISTPFQDFNLSIPDIVTNMKNTQRSWFILRSWGDGGVGNPATKCYGTVCSQTYPDPAKRPRLRVVYTIPGNSTTVATLQVDDCVSSGNCENPVFNPYVTGILGNWRVKKQLLFDTKRVNNKGATNGSDPTGTNIRNSGYFEVYIPYWTYSSPKWNPSTEDKWQWTSEVTKFSRKGQEIENTDPLGRFSGAQYGYLESLPVAVAGNARYREIGYDGFEDYQFGLGQPNSIPDSCGIQDHFSFRSLLGAAATLDNTKAHSGKFSLKLNGTITMQKPMLQTEPATIYGIDAENQYKITNSYLRHGFQPVPGPAETGKYILSGWVYDGQPKSPTINGLTLVINGTSHNVNNNASSPAVYSKVHVVEGWKRFEVVFTNPSIGNFSLQLGGSNIYVDDIRIHPYAAQLKSFAYDASSLRLMAEMDENNFATFYEYDDEGTLIRVKKETEKGISTIRETRSSIRKKNL